MLIDAQLMMRHSKFNKLVRETEGKRILHYMAIKAIVSISLSIKNYEYIAQHNLNDFVR